LRPSEHDLRSCFLPFELELSHGRRGVLLIRSRRERADGVEHAVRAGASRLGAPVLVAVQNLNTPSSSLLLATTAERRQVSIRTARR